MADEFLEEIGLIALAFAWLEDLTSEFIHELCGTKKAVVFTRRMGFSAKCDKIEDLAKFSTDAEYRADVLSWIKDCRKVAGDRNRAIHSRQMRTSFEGIWQRVDDGTETSAPEMSITGLSNCCEGANPIRTAGRRSSAS